MLAAKRETVVASSGDAWSKRVEGILRPTSGTTSFDCCKLFQLAVRLVAFTSAKLPTRVSIARRRTVEGEEAPIFISEASKLDPDQSYTEMRS